MTVQELIEQLQQVENKSLPVTVIAPQENGMFFEVEEVHDNAFTVFITTKD